ncbi:thiamine diphosphokinase [Paenalkalicoccus suaedae]|uniref:Thiamine diphosphokinase n=1 Tax=Paenalkalicoccus suaedae TaxID=2592382 RepID=A0A859FF78_9BACI|nr:thiamine diphosphokinase [Paenalkalicoccus suaedae]QKS71478.1 thiamine diphosphokinase [Paenalkalicoccus suaedae]
MTYLLVAGGPKVDLPSLQELCDELKPTGIIGVDRGAYYLLEACITPNLAIGDFDSIGETYLKQLKAESVELTTFPAEKDQTDMELALDIVKERFNAKKLIIVGATGGRLDHFLMNVQLLEVAATRGIEVEILNTSNRMSYLDSGVKHVKHSIYTYLSLLAITEKVSGITLTGVKYELTNAQLKRGSSLCVSNEIVDDEAIVKIESGKVIVIESKDEN